MIMRFLLICLLMCVGCQGKKKTPEETPKFIVKKSEAMLYAPKIYLIGEVVSDQKYDINAKVAGDIQTIDVKEGESLKAQTKLLTINDFGQRKSAYEAAQAHYAKQKFEHNAVVKLYQQKLRSESMVKQQEKELREAEHTLFQAQEEWEALNVLMPADGVVEKIHVHKGQHVTQGVPLVYVRSHDQRVKVKLPSVYTVRKNAPVVVTFQGKSYPSALQSIGSLVEEGSVMLWVTLKQTLPQGTFVDVELAQDPVKAHCLPLSSTYLNDKGQLALKVVDASKKIISKPVEVMGYNAKGCAYVKGLNDSENIIVSGVHFATFVASSSQ